MNMLANPTRSKPHDAASSRDSRVRVLVAIASFGTKNLDLLKNVIRCWRAMPFTVHVVVVSEAPKDLGDGVEVVVGLPSENPWSLPFAHKPIFAANADRYDLFAYSEDDMEFMEEHLRAFLRLTPHLQSDEIAGFLRYEVDRAGRWTYPDAHGHFHWKPESVRRRGEHLIAEFTNAHAASYLLTRDQLKRAVASGGYLRAPYEGRHDMLCSAATDPYTSCGFRKVVCISNLEAFSIHHLSDRYVGQWCVPLETFHEQLRAQQAIADGKLPVARLMPTETLLSRGQWSKNYYEPADEHLLRQVPASARTVLSVGCGWGALEARVQRGGAAVTALPLDAVIGASAAERGIEVVHGPLQAALGQLKGRRFDCVVISNLLHLAASPQRLLDLCTPFVAPGGALVIRGLNFASLRIAAKRALARGEHEKLRSYAESGVHRVGPGFVRRYLKRSRSNLDRIQVHWPSHTAQTPFEQGLGRFGTREWVLQATASGADVDNRSGLPAPSRPDRPEAAVSRRRRTRRDATATGLAEAVLDDRSPAPAQRQARILFVIENDHYPQDMRVYNECTALARRSACFVIAPRGKGQKSMEDVGTVRCYRYPAIEGKSAASLLVEYALACACMVLWIPLLVRANRINVIHVANPPDIVIPTLAWLKLFGVKVVFDAHDISTETLKGKMNGEKSHLAMFLPVLELSESLSIRAADLAIATNDSIAARIARKFPQKRIVVVRNSNAIVYRSLGEIGKPAPDGVLHIGYFGVLANDAAAGLDNILLMAASLDRRTVPFRFSIVGSGPGLPRLKQVVKEAGLESRFCYHGFVKMPAALDLIKTFDFGLVSWGDMPKNHLHTAMKVMDYMCCAVPVCSLELKEQIKSTGGIGVHASSFEQIAERVVAIYRQPDAYQDLRRESLRHFNEVLCWELQEKKLMEAYRSLLR
jgi:glycosyltransferase involved in cell wall biosynthesis